MAVGSGLEILRPLEVELTDNDTRTEIPVLLDDLNELRVGLLASSIGIDIDRERLGYTNGIRKLNEHPTGKASGNQRLG